MKRNIILSITLLMVFSGSPPVGSKSPYPPVIRPGAIGSNGENGTDFFIDLFLPFAGTEKAFVFLAPNLRIDDASAEETNVGIGFRIMDDNAIFGLNAYRDAIETSNNNRYEQWALGIEALSKWVDLRSNYYHPTGKRKKLVGPRNTFRFGSTSILVAGDTETALKGYDAEIGILLPFISAWFETRAHAGGYWYDSNILADDSGIKGVKYRIESRANRLINLILEITNDSMAGTDVYYGGYFELAFSLEDLLSLRNPFKIEDKQWRFADGTRPLRERMTDKVVRDRYVRTIEVSADDLSASEYIEYISEAYPDGIDVIYVNADAPQNGSGTYDDPYKDINSAAADPRYVDAVWIYVFSSDGRADTYDNVHLALKNNSVLWGEGYRHPILNLGGYDAPIFDGASSGNVITLANNNEVMGLTIQNGGFGIYGADIKLTNIHDNTINNALILSRFSGADISDDSVCYRFADNHLLNNSNDSYSGIQTDVEFNAPTSISLLDITTEFIDNTTTGTAGYNYGISARNYVKAPSVSETSITNLFSGNNFTDNSISADNKIYAYAQPSGSGGSAGVVNSSITNTLLGNAVTGNDGAGAYLYNSIGAFASNGQSVSGNVSASVDSSHISNYFAGNDITNNYGYGLESYNYISSAGNSWAGITGDFLLSAADSSINNVFISNETGDNSAGSGVYLENDIRAFAALYAALTRYLTMSVASSKIYNAFSQNTSSLNNGYGFEIYDSMRADSWICQWRCGWPVSAAGIASSGIDNVFTDNGADNNSTGGIYLHGSTVADPDMDNSALTALMSDSTAANNAGYGVRLEYSGSGIYTADLGGGTLGSTGRNSMYGNSLYDLSAYTGADIKAENNWWGGDWDPWMNGQIELGSGTIDYTPWLRAEP